MESGSQGGHNEPVLNEANERRGTARNNINFGIGLVDEDQERRRGGKRLTTKEEILLFEICIRHAGTFGRRSSICDWWRAVAAEFTLNTGRAYSWHSVRRKVDGVATQRDKFLKNKNKDNASYNQDSMNPRWCEVLDEWLPTWRVWEDSEAKRIAKRDELVKRRSMASGYSAVPKKSRSSIETKNHSQGDDSSSFAIFSTRDEPGVGAIGFEHECGDSSVRDVEADASHVPSPQSGQGYRCHAVRGTGPQRAQKPSPAPHFQFEALSTNIGASVKLPPGYENMFSNPPPVISNYNTPSRSQVSVPSTTPSSMPPPDYHLSNTFNQTPDSTDIALDPMLENNSPGTRIEPDIDALVRAAAEASAQSQLGPDLVQQREGSQDSLSIDIENIKEQLRREIKAEIRQEMNQNWAAMESKIDSVQSTQQKILEMLSRNLP